MGDSVVRRALVVNGDDFGLTPGVNAGIVEAHLRGILTSASLFANAPATDDAIRLARQTASLGVGCHLALVDGTPVAPASRVSSLAPDGAFRPTWGAFLRAAVANTLDVHEVEIELSAQIERLRSSGIVLTHLDGHKHVHAYPPVFEIVARLAHRFGIPAVRVPFERPAIQLLARWLGTGRARRQALENLALAPWAARDRALLAQHGLAEAAFRGRALTGLLTPARLRETIERLPPGVSELMMHPGYADAALGRVRTRLREQRAAELALLTDPETLDVVHRARVVLVRHDGRPQRESHVA
jgi:predicted glycoside hydrolase/deacetylase ChbG (UPF0249 family)